MTADPRAGKLVAPEGLVDLSRLERAYFEEHPDPAVAAERVAFGTSGHRGSSLRRTFNEDHIASTAAAIGEWRHANGVEGPLYLGRDTHALSAPAQQTALEVLAARGVAIRMAPGGSFTPTPAVSRAVLAHNAAHRGGAATADGIVVTPSHNPPEDGGFKYNPPHGGPADAAVTSWIERRANELLTAGGARSIPRMSVDAARRAGLIVEFDFLGPYVEGLGRVIDVAAIARAGATVGIDPMGGASLEYWGRIAERYGLRWTVVNRTIDPTFRFVPADHDGKIRTDCSSPYAMANLLAQKDRFDLALGNDADADRHGIVTPREGLLTPNHYLSVAIDYLFRHRRDWPSAAAVGKTAVTSSMVDRVAASVARPVQEVPVGFKWFVPGLLGATLGFAGEESAGASFLAQDGTAWTTDKDGILLGLLAAEILSVTGQDPGARYASLEGALGRSHYARRDAAAPRALRDRLRAMTPDDWTSATLAGDPCIDKRTSTKSGPELGGLKVETASAWFAVRPSGTEDVYKLYAESFRSEDHLRQVLDEAGSLVARLEAGLERASPDPPAQRA